MRQIWHLDTRSTTLTRHRLYCKNGWVDDDSDVAIDSVLVKRKDWEAPRGEFDIQRIRDLMPGHLVAHAVDMIRSSLAPPSNSSCDSGLRVEVRAAYLYHVIVDQNDQKSEFFVSGCSNTVTPHKMPERSSTLSGRLVRGINGFFEATGLAARSTTDAAYVQAVKNGEVHLSDIRQVAADLRKLGAKATRTPDGYSITLPRAPKRHATVQVKFDYDSANNCIIHSAIFLCQADRHQFPRALALSRDLTVGCIALEESNDRSIESFYLVDRQPYGTVSAVHYYELLKQLLVAAYRIHIDKKLG
nr:hypothetical protein [Rhodopirellula sp. SM50]